MSRALHIDDFGADPTGRIRSDAAWAAAYRAATQQITAAGGGAMVEFGPGTYDFSLGTVAIADRRIGIRGQGNGVTVLRFTGSSGAAVVAGGSDGGTGQAAPLVDFTVSGWECGPQTVGLHYGDRAYARIELEVSGFAAAGSQNLLFRNDANAVGGCEGTVARIHTSAGGASLISFDGSGDDRSFDYSEWWFHVVQGRAPVAGEFAMCQFINGAHAYGSTLTLLGNVSGPPADSEATSVVFKVGTHSRDISRLSHSELHVVVECDAGYVSDLVIDAGAADERRGGVEQCSGRFAVFAFGGSGSGVNAGRLTGTCHASMTGVLNSPVFSETGRLSGVGAHMVWEASMSGT